MYNVVQPAPVDAPRTPSLDGVRLGDAVVDLLIDRGIDFVFGIPGSHNLGLYQALDGAPLRHISSRHEQGAGFMADGAARSTGRTSICAVISGPGVTNVATAIGQAYSDAVPMLVIAGDLPLSQRGGKGGHSHELRNQDAVLRAVTEHVVRPGSADDVLHGVERALQQTSLGRPSPWVVQVPEDMWMMTVPSRQSTVPNRFHVDSELVGKAARTLSRAVQPVIVAGGGAMACSQHLVALADKLDSPVLTTLNGKGSMPATHRLHAGITTQQFGVPHGAAQRLLESADVILAVGTELGPTDFWAATPNIQGHLIHIDTDPSAIGRQLAVATGIVGTAEDVIPALLEEVSQARRGGADRAALYRQTIFDEAAPLGRPFRPWIEALRAAIPDDGCLAVDSTEINYYGATPYYDVRMARSWLNPSGLGTLGYAVPAAIGAAVATTDRAVVALVGDGGLMFTVPELAVAAELNLPLVTVVWANGGYGEIARLLVESGSGPIGCGQAPLDYSALARGFGCRFDSAESPQALAEAVRRGLKAKEPSVVVIQR